MTKQLPRLSDTTRGLIYDQRQQRLLRKKRSYLQNMLLVADYYRMLPFTRDPEKTREAVTDISRAQFFRLKKEFDQNILGIAE